MKMEDFQWTCERDTKEINEYTETDGYLQISFLCEWTEWEWSWPCVGAVSLSLCLSVCVCLSVCLSVCLFLCRSVYLSVCLSVSVCLSLFLCLSICQFVCLSVSLSVCLYLSVCLSFSVCLSVCLSVSLSLCLSVCLYLSVCLSLSVVQRIIAWFKILTIVHKDQTFPSSLKKHLAWQQLYNIKETEGYQKQREREREIQKHRGTITPHT